MPAAHTNMPGIRHLVTCYHQPQVGAGQAQAASGKLQAKQSVKQQASSYAKRGWFESFINFQGASGKRQAPSSKHQAASHELQAL
jgi:hypothetical protein